MFQKRKKQQFLLVFVIENLNFIDEGRWEKKISEKIYANFEVMHLTLVG